MDVLAKNVSEDVRKLMDAFWPGPLTIVVEKSDIVPKETTGGLNTVAIRMPSHPVALELIRQSGVYIAAPSANRSGRPSPVKAQHVIEDLDGRIEYILDGGDVDIGIESTIVDMTGDVPMILRPGYITPEMIRDVLGKVEFDPAIMGQDETLRPKAPGMKYTHYAPQGELTIVEGERQNVVAYINDMVKEKRTEGFKVGVLAAKESAALYDADVVLSMGSRAEPITVSAKLYSCLRDFDTEGTDYMYSESFAGDSLGNAIMNRLLKAAGHRTIQV
jgi:L-threonylcarbamoyladenylate synthase